MEAIVFGGGCFWCTEAVFLRIKGVQSVEPGYAGPQYTNEGNQISLRNEGNQISLRAGPSYEEVATGATPYVESAKVAYDPDLISFPELLQVFFGSHDPTEVNRQGSDVGPQYRSVVFYTTERQKKMTEHYINTLNLTYAGAKKIATTVEPLEYFYKAEAYHEKYYENHKDAPYCRLVITPKVEKVRGKFKNLLK